MTEEHLAIQCSHYMQLQYPDVIFHHDFGSGVKLTMGQARKQKALNPHRGWPDMFIAESNGHFNGLFIELKKEGVAVFKKDGTIRKDKHLEEQYAMLKSLANRGFAATFCIGLDQFREVVDLYMGGSNE